MGIAIKVENVSKLYRLGTIGTGSITSDITRFWHNIRGKEDPFTKIGETNDRSSKGSSDYVWSLKDIDFEIEQGDAVGIIGRNGAGKSTLLKLISRITSPTTGTIKARGRIASLLEVGTGFHPELTGRENIFLNGAILGMKKKEIERNFDAIVDFSGVERYIDTPVKRYSSGMYVRLAFAVAAHLESEILIVDEVLAVGDAEFQKKCLGKMNDVSKGEGRTILFVSHNMPAILNLCQSGLILENGRQIFQGNINDVTEHYLGNNRGTLGRALSLPALSNEELLNNKKAKIRSIDIHNEDINYLEDMLISVSFETAIDYDQIVMGVGINTLTGIRLLTIENIEYLVSVKAHELLSATIRIPAIALAPGQYTLSAGIRPLSYKGSLDYLPDALNFEVKASVKSVHLTDSGQLGMRPIAEWSYSKP